MNAEQLLGDAERCIADQGKLKTSSHSLCWQHDQFKLIRNPIAIPGLVVIRKFTFNEMQNGLTVRVWIKLKHEIQTLIIKREKCPEQLKL